jgi:hypothetical protein
MEANRPVTTDSKAPIVPDWQIKQVRDRTDEYLKDPSIAQDFNEAIKEIENELL